MQATHLMDTVGLQARSKFQADKSVTGVSMLHERGTGVRTHYF